MARRDERMTEAHPADDELDRLRAGLIEGSSREHERLRAHLEGCARCQARERVWIRARESLEALAREPGLAARLRARRERALRGESAARRGRRAAVAVFATVVVAAVAVGLGTWTYLGHEAPDAQLASGRDNVPDLYADIDFYLWLLEREAANQAPNG